MNSDLAGHGREFRASSKNSGCHRPYLPLPFGFGGGSSGKAIPNSARPRDLRSFLPCRGVYSNAGCHARQVKPHAIASRDERATARSNAEFGTRNAERTATTTRLRQGFRLRHGFRLRQGYAGQAAGQVGGQASETHSNAEFGTRNAERTETAMTSSRETATTTTNDSVDSPSPYGPGETRAGHNRP